MFLVKFIALTSVLHRYSLILRFTLFIYKNNITSVTKDYRIIIIFLSLLTHILKPKQNSLFLVLGAIFCWVHHALI